MTYRVIALDLDGTLLTQQKTLSPASVAALQRARDAGYQLLIATGRHHVAIHPFYQALALDTPAICCNGAYLYDYPRQAVLEGNPLSARQALQVLDVLDARGIHALMYVDDAMLYETPTGHVARTLNWAQSLPAAQRPTFRQVPSLREAALAASAIWKFALTGEAVARLKTAAEELNACPGLACEWSWRDQVDVVSHGNSKGSRLARWVETQGLHMKQVVAFGDNFNDLSMLEAAGLGIAMGNADDAIKARADKVTGTNQEDGIADAIYRWLL
ncbi:MULTISPECIES: pyridoxal phosphatase [Tenebrionibacter/Tenebrionicola group]|jgi:Cof subfamily protein (haloacid dehalogenase superfamily)|uniref:Pyridoxal phosphatase n=2 Tax=Tenebrionibacter/Tenebrionicola group TaxID=2969848 RepID=A0A8K0V5F1_9ENTR|nr:MULTISPECIES: pyridoxal phosphatase [Tenebrionibacter/Tenebrionicola group]MBK4714522.1 pyridoxal phosphatase [Tenebrionibacter intestinalis]MBV5095424.1 pyridoxal phosphatase [Tenebrionicola larvae]